MTVLVYQIILRGQNINLSVIREKRLSGIYPLSEIEQFFIRRGGKNGTEGAKK